MKKLLVAAFVIALAGISTASAQSFSAGVGPNKRAQIQRRPAPLYQRGPVGAFPRAARGNPIQMINPRAPRKYFGPIQDTVTLDPDDPSRVTGLIFFGFRW